MHESVKGICIFNISNGALMIIDLYQSDPQNNLPDNMFYVLWLLVDWKKRKNEMGNA